VRLNARNAEIKMSRSNSRLLGFPAVLRQNAVLVPAEIAQAVIDRRKVKAKAEVELNLA